MRADTDRVKFGVVRTYNTEVDNSGTTYSKIMSIKGANIDLGDKSPVLEEGENLAIFDDGSLLAKKLRAENAYIEGTIHATGGTIGGL
jgi:hypothetical protein